MKILRNFVDSCKTLAAAPPPRHFWSYFMKELRAELTPVPAEERGAASEL